MGKALLGELSCRDRKSYCTDGSGGVDVSKMLKFYMKAFFMMGKVLTGEPSCNWADLVFIE